MKRIGVVVAMAMETEALVNTFGAVKRQYDYGAMTIKEFDRNGKEVFFATCTEGEIMSSACTQYLISECGAELIFNYGLAGALADFCIGKTLIVKGVAHYEFDISPLSGSVRGKYDRFESTIIPTDAKLRAKIKELHPDIEEVICASGDKFIADEKTKAALKNEFGAGVCEMEAAGVLITARNAGVPQVIIKIVSDGADGADGFRRFVEEKNSEYFSLVAEILDEL